MGQSLLLAKLANWDPLELSDFFVIIITLTSFDGGTDLVWKEGSYEENKFALER